MNTITTIKDFLSGYKTYATAIAAMVIAVGAWSEDALTNAQFGAAVFTAIQTIWVRAAITKIGHDAENGAYDGARDAAEGN